MIFSVLLIVLVLGVTYVHYLQGAFTAAISLACTLAATLVAFGYYESAVNAMQQNGFADYAGGLSLVAIFAVTYALLRVAADALVPGNISLQLYVERVGAAVLGAVAAVLGVGVFATGVQMLPFGPAVAGFSPFEVRDRDVTVPAEVVGRSRGDDSGVFSELVPDNFNAPGAPLLPADGLTLSLVRTASAGAFAGRQNFSDIHPDLAAEAFYARAGSEHSDKHVILNTAKQTNATVDHLYTLAGPVVALDTEIPDIRNTKQSIAYKPSSSDTLLVVRVAFADPGADKDGIVRLTPAAARLVTGGQTYFPVGTMEGSSLLAINRLDDLIAVASSPTRSADLVYALPKSAAETLAKTQPDDGTIAFVEFKLFGRVDLAGKKPEPFAGAPATTKVLRKAGSPLGIAAKIGPKPQ